MTVKFHVNNKGEPGKCFAKQGNCPFGDETNHYDNASEARTAYEKKNNSHQIPVKTRFPRVEILFTQEIDIEPQFLKTMIRNEMPFKSSVGSARKTWGNVSIIFTIKENVDSDKIELELRKIISPHSNYFEIIVR